MGLLNIFKRQTPEEFYSLFAHDIVIHSLAYQSQIEGISKKQSILVGAELCWYLLHWVDRCAFAELGEEGRDIVFDNVAALTINEYTDMFGEDNEEHESLGDEYTDTLGKRQITYGKCKVDEECVAGSMGFALACFMHQVVHGTCTESLIDTITINQKVSTEDVDYLPDFEEVLLINIFSVEYLKSLDIKKRLKQYISICSK